MIATAAIELVSLDALYKETPWDTLGKRRENHKLTLCYKIIYNFTFTPPYLSLLALQSVK